MPAGTAVDKPRALCVQLLRTLAHTSCACVLLQARRAGLPLVLVLGITSSHNGLLQLLPNSTLRRIQLLQLSLPPAWQQLARFYG